MAENKFNTVRDLELSNKKWFKMSGTIFLVGLLMALFVIVPWISILGYAGLAVGVVLVFIGMLRIIQLSKEPTRTIYCPYCASKNDVFMTRTELPCDICRRKFGVSASGEVHPLEKIEEDED